MSKARLMCFSANMATKTREIEALVAEEQI